MCFGISDLKLESFVDAYLADDFNSRKSTTSFVFTLGGTTISWKVVTLSTIEAKYVALIEGAKYMIWLQSFMKELG